LHRDGPGVDDDPKAVMPPRPHPFDLMFGGFRSGRLPAIRETLQDTRDLDAFLLAPAALELLRELRPDDGLGEAVGDFVALVYAAYLFWCDGERTVVLDESTTRQLCSSEPGAARAPAAVSKTRYIQLAPHIVWGQLNDTAPYEPLDGWFTIHGDAGFRLVACFGVHAHRPGVSVATVGGTLVAPVRRSDGTGVFEPRMPGGGAARLFAVNTPDDLLLLAWRASASPEVAAWA
jgi:hypothetical protein